MKPIVQKTLFLFCVFLFLTSCGKSLKKEISVIVNTPDFKKLNPMSSFGAGSDIITGIQPIHISIEITDQSGNVTRQILNVGDNIIKIPVGQIKVRTGFLASSLYNDDTIATKCARDNTSTQTVSPRVEVRSNDEDALYSETEFRYTIDSTSLFDRVEINYPAFSRLTFSKFAFKVVTNSAAAANNASFTFIDPISNLEVSDPCTGIPFTEYADVNGLLPIDLPVWNLAGIFIPRVSYGNTKNDYQFNPNPDTSIIQFKYIDTVNGSIRDMNPATEQFIPASLGGQNTINARIAAGKNPRFGNSSVTTTGFSSNLSSLISGHYPCVSLFDSDNIMLPFDNELDPPALNSEGIFSLPLNTNDLKRKRTYVIKCKQYSASSYSKCWRNSFLSKLGLNTLTQLNFIIEDSDGYVPFNDCSTVSGTTSGCSYIFTQYVQPDGQQCI